jgi:glycosyltransferase involved in cell wall biosynthesis
LELRNNDFENDHSLPIKLFYYLALGRPVIYTNLKAIQREVAIKEFGYLVDPTDINQIVTIIEQYCVDKNLYRSHCLKAREYSLEKYNWKNIEPAFLSFVQ